MYDRLFKSKNTCWKAMKKPYHLLFVIHDLLDRFAVSPNLVPAYEKRLFVNTCLDAVANYLNELNAESSMNEMVIRLKNNFKDLQSKLERIIKNKGHSSLYFYFKLLYMYIYIYTKSENGYNRKYILHLWIVVWKNCLYKPFSVDVQLDFRFWNQRETSIYL